MLQTQIIVSMQFKSINFSDFWAIFYCMIPAVAREKKRQKTQSLLVFANGLWNDPARLEISRFLNLVKNPHGILWDSPDQMWFFLGGVWLKSMATSRGCFSWLTAGSHSTDCTPLSCSEGVRSQRSYCCILAVICSQNFTVPLFPQGKWLVSYNSDYLLTKDCPHYD